MIAMIRQSFILLPNVGYQREASLWSSGIKDWDDFLAQSSIRGFPYKAYFDRKLLDAKKSLYEEKSEYFTNCLPKTEHWRLYHFFREDAIFLDIESSGIGGYLTVIGIYDGQDTKTMIKGINMEKSLLVGILKNAKLIITFNGSAYDIPQLEKEFHIRITQPHIDLRSSCVKLGIKGGLKEIEKSLDMERKNILVEKLHNGDPFTLWKMWRATGDDHYLNLLVEYNEEDCINLKKIADLTYRELMKKALVRQWRGKSSEMNRKPDMVNVSLLR